MEDIGSTPVTPIVIVHVSGGVVQDAYAAAGTASVFVLDEDVLSGDSGDDDVEEFRDHVLEAAYAVLKAQGRHFSKPNDLPWARRLIREANLLLYGEGDTAEADDDDGVVYAGSGGRKVGDHRPGTVTVDLGDPYASLVALGEEIARMTDKLAIARVADKLLDHKGPGGTDAE